MARALGKALRETGQALERLGRSLQGNYSFREESECPGWIAFAQVCWLHQSAAAAAAVSAAAANAPTLPSAPAVNRHRTLAPVLGKQPSLGSGVFVAPSAAVIGNVTLGPNSSVFYGSVVRG